MAAGLKFELDPEERISFVDSHWDDFAVDNGAPELAGGTVLGRRLWDFVHGDETRLILRSVLDRARRRARDVLLPFRCDSPRVRRFMTFEIAPGSDGGLRIRTDLVREEPRQHALEVLERFVPRGTSLLRMCSWCNRVVGVEGAWQEIEEALARLELVSGGELPRITHGICPRCERLMAEGIDMEGGGALDRWGSA